MPEGQQGEAAAAPTSWAQAREASQQMILQAAMEDVESKAAKLEEELRDSKQKVEQQAEKLTSMRLEMDQLEASLETKSTKLQSIQSDYQSKVNASERLEEATKDREERLDRVQSEADSLRQEISRLNKTNVDCMEKLVGLETQAKLGDSEVVPLRYQVQRLTAEVDSISSHSTWLEAELKTKNEQIANLRTTHASDMAEVRRDFDSAAMERDALDGEANTLKRQLQQAQSRMERLSQELRDSQQEATDTSLAMEQELIASQRVATIQKEQIERLQQRHDSMAGQMNSLQKLAIEAEQDGNREMLAKEQELNEKTKLILQEQAEDYKQQLANLGKKLDDANHRCKQAEDGLLLTNAPSYKAIVRQPLAIQDEPATERDEPLNLTDLYGRVTQTEDNLAAETLRRKKAEIRVARIEADIQAKAPELIRQRKEYEMVIERQEEYKKRLQNALEEAQSSRSESSELQMQVGRMRKRNKELEDDATELAKQVQTLLVSRSNSTLGMDGGSHVPASVVEMQTTNQRLLKEHRRLTATIADLESKLQEDNMRNKVETYEKELSTLREDRRRQQVLVEGIVQQRDLYRALLNKQDNNLLGSQSEEASTLQIVQQQSQRSRDLEDKNRKLELDLDVALAKLGTIDRNTEAASERLARYEALNAELTNSVDRLQVQVSTSKADVARSKADATYHKDKMIRMEENLQSSKEEVSRVTASKGDLQRINQGLQEAVSKGNAEAGKLEGELNQAKMKLRLAEAQAETAKKAEERIGNESSQLRNEVSRQGALIESIQRIEASLSAKTVADEASSKAQVAALSDKLSLQESKFTAEVAKLNDIISDHTLRIQEIEKEREQAVREALGAKRDYLKANSELQESNKKSKTLEAQLRLAKKKLGAFSDEEDTEAQLRNKVLSLTEELEAASKESEALKERVSAYAKLAKDNENAVAELTEATKAAEKAQKEEVGNLKSQLDTSQSESAKTKEVIAELTNDLSSQREEREKAVQEVTQKLSEMESEAVKFKKDAQAAESRHADLEAEVIVLRADASNSQNNYERELALHATARTDLRAAKEEAEAGTRLRKVAEEQVESLKSEIAEQRLLLEQEKSTLEKSLKEYENNLKETRAQNTLLHAQLEKIGNQIEKIQGGKTAEEGKILGGEDTDELLNMQKTISELREVVKFVRSEKEMLQAQLDSVRRTADRERAAAALAKRSLDEARAELRIVQEASQSGDASSTRDIDGLREKLQAAEEQTRLLGESNAHLREELKKLEAKFSSINEELEKARTAAQPSEKRQQELEGEKVGFVAEKESLLREINDWKGRVQSLVTKFNQVDPVEHGQVVQKVEKLEKEMKTLESEKAEAEAESKRIRQLAGRASKNLQQNKQLVEIHKKTIEKLTLEKEALTKANKATISKKDLDEVKTKLVKVEEERANEKIQLTGANQMNEKLRERLRQFKNTIEAQNRKEALLNSQLEEAKSKLKEAETKSNVVMEKNEISGKIDAFKSGKESSVEREESKPDVLKEKSAVSSNEAPKELPTAEKKLIKVVPKVPAGGFQFGPSETAKNPASSIDASPSEPSGKLVGVASSQGSKKRPIDSTDGNESKKKPLSVSVMKKDKPVRSVQSPGEQAVGEEKLSEGNAEASKSSAPLKRSAGEKKESSFKEKLLEKKRKLMMDMKKKQDLLKKSQEVKQVEEKSTEDEPSTKRAKVDDSEVPKQTEATESTAVDGGTTGAEEPASAEKLTVLEKADNEKVEKEETAGEDAGETSKEEQTLSESQSKEEKSSTPTTFSAPASTGAFGSGSTKSFVFGQASQPGTTTSTFGVQASSFGGGAAFGATSVFGKNAEATSTSAFGGVDKKSEVVSTSAFGGAFLNMKPPGSSTEPPQFSFGSSSSITLPTPSSISPQASLFNAFSSPSFNSGGVGAKPLFGSKKAESIVESKKDDDEEEDGEMEDGEEK